LFFYFNSLLVYIILFAKSKLTLSGLVKIIINEEDVLETEGFNLLSTLSNKKIFLLPQPAVAVVLAECVNAKYYLVVVKYYRLKHLYFSRKENSKTTEIRDKGKAGYENSNSASVMGIKNGNVNEVHEKNATKTPMFSCHGMHNGD
jgi:Na+-transporting NADH:ubiquinone oxidoreductase subunit F